ncbi:hypothetical protein BDE02_01G325900 [Populus trichocarpa]|nr:hypothetical protein BDE02_01G325900 [Populus trichocarpa]
MLQTSFALLLALWLSVSNLDYAETRKVHTMSISMPTSRSATSPTSSRLSLICDSTSSTCWLRFTTISGQLSTSSSSVLPAPPPPPMLMDINLKRTVPRHVRLLNSFQS